MAECDQTSVDFTQITQRKLRTVRYLWKIENFSYLPHKCGDELASDEFSATKSETDVKWSLSIYPKGYGEDDNDYLSVYLNCDGSEVAAKSKFAILGAKRGLGEDSKRKKYEGPDEEPDFFDADQHAWGHPKFIELSELEDENKGLLPGDTLNLLCEVTYAGEETVVKPSPVAVTERHIVMDFEKLFDDGQFSDCKIVVGDVVFQVHKLVLMARSDVFAAMFQHPLDEQRKGVITITDFDSEVVRELLRFIYTDATAKLTEMSEELLRAAEKYQLGRLKQMCEGTLYEAISIDNVCDTLLMADTYRADQLKKHAEQFVAMNTDAVRKTDGWIRLTEKHQGLLFAALTAK